MVDVFCLRSIGFDKQSVARDASALIWLSLIGLSIQSCLIVKM